MKKIAIPLVGGYLSEYFGQCESYEIFIVEGESFSSESLEVPPREDIEALPEWAASMGITDIIAYKIDKRILNLFTPYRINLFIGIPIAKPEAILAEYVSGRLKSDKHIINELMDKAD